MSKTRFSRRMIRTLVLIGALLMAVVGLYGLARVYLSYLWYQAMGQQGVFVGRIVSQLATAALCAIVAFLVLGGTSSLAGHLAGVTKRLRRITLWGSAALAAVSGISMSTNWMVFRLAVAGSPFGITEPLFNKDVGFFVFSLPALEILYSWIIGLLVLATILVLAVVFIPEQSGLNDGYGEGWWHLKTSGSVLAALFVLFGGAFGFYLSIYKLEFSARGLVSGATYTDAHVRVPALWFLLAASVALAILLVVTSRSRKFKLPVGALVVWVLLTAILTGAVPTLVQNYVVSPNEATLEEPYIQYNIDLTRKAYELDEVSMTAYPAVAAIPKDRRDEAADSLADVRLWTPAVAKSTFTQLQTIRPYYKLSKLETDRYTMEDGETQRQMLVSSRLMDTSGLPKRANTWVNKHLVYTHGYGSAMSSVSESNQGMLQFALGDVPPRVSEESTATPTSLASAQQRLYFGPGMSDYVITNTSLDEFDYPKEGENATCRDTDVRGVAFGGFVRRLAWAINFNSTDVLFSSYPKSDSIVISTRDIVTRAKRIAPWLSYDAEPYSAVVDGRTVWILDGYTSSSRFPYSQPLTGDSQDAGKNYLRESVKVVVDAETGETTFYAMGDDPIRDAWAKIFPSVITPESEVPMALAEHFLYPQRALDAQAQVYLTYHMTDPMTFYDKEDQWQISKTSDGSDAQTSYLMLSMPDEPGKLRMHLMQSFAPVNTNNLISLMTAGCDPQNYGKLTVYQLPKEHVTLSIEQVSAEINQDPEIAPQIALWNQSGSSVIMGDMLMLPVADSIVYVQPVFLQAQKTAVTQLARVIVVNNNKTAMGLNLQDALEKVYETNAAE